MTEPERRRAPRGVLIAGVLTAALGLPLVVFYTIAARDGVTRHEQTPLRAVLGDARYEALAAGQGGFPHYLGDSLAAPDFTLEDRRARPWRLSEQRGKLLIVNFWSVTCPPCVEELPTLEVLAHLVSDWDDVEVVAISGDESWEAASAVLPPRPRITHLLDPGREVITGEFGARLFPETWIIDREGVVRFRFDGALDWSNPVILSLIRGYL